MINSARANNHASQNMAYIQARIRLMLQSFPSVEQWLYLKPIHEYRHYIHEASKQRPSALLNDLRALDHSNQVHELEQRLRHDYVASVQQLQGWAPAAFKVTLNWMQLLPYLDLLRGLFTQKKAPQWLHEDHFLSPYINPHDIFDKHAFGQAGYGELYVEQQKNTAADINSLWWQGLQKKLPAKNARQSLLIRQTGYYLKELLAPPLPQNAACQYRPLAYQRLQHQVATHPLDDITVIAFVALLFWNYRLLLAELSSRLLLAEGGKR